jgi:formylglycine-generating enzyme required for sulfatase activity
MGGRRITTEATLPFERLSPKDFERLCFALLAAEGHTDRRHWGAAGSEGGCDLVSTAPDGRRVVTQCKRVKSLSPDAAEKELRKVLKKPPSPEPELWSLVAACDLSRNLEEQLAKIAGGKLGIELCGLSELDERVRRFPDLVDWFFGAAVGAAVEAPLWWVSAAPVDRAWAEPFAADLAACLRRVRPDARVELAVPSEVTPYPDVPDGARWGLVVVTPEALAHSRLRQLWQQTLCTPCRSGGRRRLLALSLEPAPWPPWLEERFERIDPQDGGDQYRIDLAAIVAKYIGETEKDADADLVGPGPRAPRLPAELRGRLVDWLAPLMESGFNRKALAAALRLEPRTVLDDFETAALRASAALVLATEDDGPTAAALRILAVLRQELAEMETEERLRTLDAMGDEVRALGASSPERDDLLTAWLRQVASDHSRLVDHFQQRHELDLLDRVYVELEMAPDRHLQMAERAGAEAELRHGFTILDLLALDPEEHPWVTRRWLVRGDPGSGKTTLLRHLAARLAGERPPTLVPVFQSLPVLIRDRAPFLERLERILGRAERQGLGRVLDRAGDEGRLAVLLDGLDEVGGEDRGEAETLIRGLAERWPETPIVVTTRPIGYRRFAGDFRELVLQPLDRDRRREFLARWFGRVDGSRDEARADEALARLDGPGFEELTGNPLYLTLMALLLEDGKPPSQNRSALYDQVFELLLEGKHKLGIRDGSFEPVARPELVRRTLRLLAETMTRDNLDAEPRRKLEERLYRDELDEAREAMRKVLRWDGNLPRFLDDVAEKVGILGPHDGQDADWRFWHRTFREALVAEQMAEWPAQRLAEHARTIAGQESRWAEPFALLCGQVDDADALLRRLLDVNRALALRALATAQNVRDETVEEVLELTGNWDERSKVYEKLPELVGDADRCLRLIDRLRRGRRDGNDLYFLDRSARLVGERWSDYAEAARSLRLRLYDHVPALEDPDLLLRWRRPDGEEADLWCRIPRGVGWVGSAEDEEGRLDREGPRHRVEVTRDSWLSAIPVTNAVYHLFDDRKPFHGWDGVAGDDLVHHPRVDVTWYEAVSFCRWLAAQPGFERTSPRLPEEEVWEYACRAGSEKRFWRGEAEEDLEAAGWFGEGPRGRTHRVGRKLANPWGLYDVHGNVWEWTATQWDAERYHGREGKVHPVDPTDSPADLAGGATAGAPRVVRVLRGGGFWSIALDCRSAYRGIGDPWSVIRVLGFRVLLSSAPSRDRS